VRRGLTILVVGVLAAAAGCGGTQEARAAKPCRGAAKPAEWRHVVWIVLENKDFSAITPQAAPYMTRLAKRCGLATNMHAVTHPSLPNYLALASGSTHGVTNNGPPAENPIAGPSIFGQLGDDWSSPQESMPGNCTLTSTGRYAVKHNPAAYFTDVRGACRRRDVPLRGTPSLARKLTVVIPNMCHGMHDCPVATGDRWLARFVPELLASSTYRAGRTMLVITFDENSGAPGNQIWTAVVAPSVRPGTRSGRHFTLYGVLRTTEEVLGLPLLGEARSATSMRRAFRL
jgi:phospholipase C